MRTDIFPIQINIATMYALKSQGAILIDGGYPGRLDEFQRKLKPSGIHLDEIKLIVLTHAHWDHIGCAAEIQAVTGARILLHQKDMHFLDDPHPVEPPGLTPWGKLLIQGVKLLTLNMLIPKFNVDIIAGDEPISLAEYGIPGKIIYTPGHSWGSTSLLLEDGKVFCGDLAMNTFPMRLSPGLPVFGDDMQVIKKSWRKLLDLGASVIYPAHGKPFRAEVMRNALA